MKTKKLATSFGEIALRDAEASRQLFGLRMYPESVYHFQQAVEKASKAYGLLAGVVHSTSYDLAKQVSHRALLGMLLRVPEMMENLPALRRALRKSLDQTKLQEVGAWDAFASILQKGKSEDPKAARKTIAQVKALDASRLWKISLDLEPNHYFTKLVWQRLEEADKRNAEADHAERIVRESIGKFLGHPEDFDFMLNLYGRAGPELFPLTLVSMWHERETRYPPVDTADYWDPQSYTREKGLIKNLELFHTHTSRLCKAVSLASSAALR